MKKVVSSVVGCTLAALLGTAMPPDVASGEVALCASAESSATGVVVDARRRVDVGDEVKQQIE